MPIIRSQPAQIRKQTPKQPKKIKHRESLGNFGPAFVSDPPVVSHIQAGQVLVHLKEIDRKGVVSGGR